MIEAISNVLPEPHRPFAFLKGFVWCLVMALQAPRAAEAHPDIFPHAANPLIDSVAYYVELDPERAIRYGRSAYREAVKLDHDREAAVALYAIGNVYAHLKDNDTAARHYLDGIALLHPLGDDALLGKFYARLGIIQNRAAQYTRAIASFRASAHHYEQAGDVGGAASAHNDIGFVSAHIGEQDVALRHYEEALRRWELLGNEDGVARMLNNIGVTFHNWSGYTQALDYYTRSLAIRKRMNDIEGVVLLLNNIGRTYQEMGELDAAMKAYEEAFEYAPQLASFPSTLAYTYHNQGMVYAARGQTQQALEAYEAAERYYVEADLLGGILETWISRGVLYTDTGRHADALALLNDALAKAQYNRVAILEASALLRLGQLHARSGAYTEALPLLEASLAAGKRLGKRNLIRDSYLALSAGYEALEQPERALHYHKRYAAEEDSIFSAHSARLLAEIEARYQAEKTENENLMLRSAQSRQQAALAFLSVILLALGLAALWLYRTNRQKRRMNERLAASNAQIERERDEQKMLTQILCHDLANPLASVQGTLEVIAEAPHMLNELGPMALAVTRQGLNTISLVREMQVLERDTLQLQPVNVRDAVDAAVLVLQSRFASKGVDLELDVDPSLRVMAEPRSLSNSVVANLLTNAVKFSSPGSTVTVRATAGPDETHLCVCDHGVGIPTGIRNHLFDVHRNKSRRGTHGEGGSGLGLPLVKRFVTLYGGRIEVTSRLATEDADNHGTKVCIVLPTALPLAARLYPSHEEVRAAAAHPHPATVQP